MKRTYLTLIIMMLVIGFAAVATNLMISGKLNIGFNENDFEVYFSKATLDGEEKSEELISSDGKTISFESKKLTDIDSTSTLEYEITNNSKQYDAEVEVTCTPTDSEYINVQNNLPSNKIEAQSEGTGILTATLKTLTTEEKNETITCKLEVSAVSRTSVEAQKEEETYSIGAYLYDKDDNELTNKYLVIYSNTPHYVETDNEGYFYVEGLERGIHEIYYMGDENPNELTKEEVKTQAIDEATVTTETKKIEFKNGEVRTERESIGKEKDITKVSVEVGDKVYSKVVEDNSAEFEIDKSSYTTILCNQKVELDENEKIEISKIAQDTECKLYSNIFDAMVDHNTNNNIGTMMMLNDDELSGGLNIYKQLYFNLNGRILKASPAAGVLNNYASATYYDLKGTGKIISTQYDVVTINGPNVVVNVSLNMESARSAVRIYSAGVNSTMNVNNSNITCNTDIADWCIAISPDSEGLNIKNTNINSTRIGIYNFGNMVLENVNLYTEANAIENEGMLTIKNGKYTSKNGIILKNIKDGTATLDGGIYISESNSVIRNENGNININQTNGPMYLSSKANVWATVILNQSNLNIKANKANNCTNDAENTTSGLCVYAEGDGTGEKTSNGAIQTVSNGITYIDGGSYYGYHQGINCDNDGQTNIKNAYVYSKWATILSGTNAVINICSAQLDSDQYHLYSISAGTINYSSNVKFGSSSTAPTIYQPSNSGNIKSNYTGTCSLDN